MSKRVLDRLQREETLLLTMRARLEKLNENFPAGSDAHDEIGSTLSNLAEAQRTLQLAYFAAEDER